MTFPNRIRIIRKSNTLSQKRFAELFGVDQTAVSNWEMGKNNIDLALADRIADYFKLPVEFVYGKPYAISRPFSEWSQDEKARYTAASEEEKKMLEFTLGHGVFEGSGATVHTNTPPSEHAIKIALFGGEDEVTDDMWQEVKNFVAFIKQKKDQ
ncbi:MAG: helix-turn-helix transcriptional regulator [Clostridia bacterium]|nr:helix-turn-helix transcriptional regulator [Clostridia bacterium]